jgi:glutamate/aspartate transport system ATP-binding protein
VIELNNVSKWYGPFHVLDNCSMSIAKGEVVVICGPSGSGKSTLIKCINGLEPFTKGTITVDGISVGDRATDLPKLRSRIGMVFQNFELFPHMTAGENIVLAQQKVLSRDRAAAEAKAHELLERMGLAEQGTKYPSQLSGGQQQRVAIARALAMDPIAMLFDEPTSALDPEMIMRSRSESESRAVVQVRRYCAIREPHGHVRCAPNALQKNAHRSDPMGRREAATFVVCLPALRLRVGRDRRRVLGRLHRAGGGVEGCADLLAERTGSGDDAN